MKPQRHRVIRVHRVPFEYKQTPCSLFLNSFISVVENTVIQAEWRRHEWKNLITNLWNLLASLGMTL